MGDIWNADKLLLFLVFFIPGFISSQIYALFVGVEDNDFSKQLPAVIGYSGIHYALTGWILFVAPGGLSRGIAFYLVVLVLPIVWPPVILLLRDSEKWKPIFFRRRRINWAGIREAMLRPEASPWDRILTPDARFIRVRLKGGRFIGGYFGPGSAASTYPCERQIFISHAFTFDQDGKFGEPIDGTGVMVHGDDIETLETIQLPKEMTNGQ